MSAVVQAPGQPREYGLVGRMFVNVAFDYLTIGGGLSLIVVGVIYWSNALDGLGGLTIAALGLLLNNAHFAASTVRLYTKPGALRRWPFLTMGLPLVTLAGLTVVITWPEQIGWHLWALYLTWSPFHYAAQAFGLASMYHYRSGGSLDPVERRLLFATCMMPFLYSFLYWATTTRTGLGWFLPASFVSSHPSLGAWIVAAGAALEVLTFAAPLVVAARLKLSGRKSLPLISWLVILSNGVWFVASSYFMAFVFATFFHAIQYLGIVTIFHVKDQTARPENRRGAAFHTFWFYAICIVFGYLVFHVWPYAYVLVGYGFAESMLMCLAVINIHHFVVDRYIWRLRKDPRNQAVVSAD